MNPTLKDHLSRTLKTALVFLVAAVVCLLCSCRSNDNPTITTTTTRSMQGSTAVRSLHAGSEVPVAGVETTVVQKPYNPFGEAAAAAGVELFSQP